MPVSKNARIKNTKKPSSRTSKASRKSKSVQPHDSFFRSQMTDPEIAKNFFQHHLPRDLLARTDLSTLTPCPASFVNEALSQSHADILYEVIIDGQESYLYSLVEHQSTVNALMPLRLRDYENKILWHCAAIHGAENLRPIYSQVFYTGQEKYSAAVDFIDLFSNKELARRCFHGPHGLIDVSQIPDEELAKQTLAGAMQIVFKHVFDHDIIPILRQILPLLIELYRSRGNERLRQLLEYVMLTCREAKKNAVIRFAKWDLPKEIGEKMMGSIAKNLIREGMAKGMEKGILRERRTVALNFLREGTSAQLVAKATLLPYEEVLKLQQSLQKVAG